jgi:uncharacterized membrane protein
MTARRWITIFGAALVVSLALNLFLVGVIAGRGLGPRGRFDFQMSPAKLEFAIGRVTRVLPATDAKLLEDTFAAQRADLTQRFQALQDARKAVGAALKAEPYDDAAFTAAYETMQARSQDLQASIHAVLRNSIGEFSDEGRRAIAERRWRR